MGEHHARTLSSRVRGARVTVVHDALADRAAALADRLPGARAVTDAIAAIEAADVDAVVLASPGAAHEQQLLACLRRGLPVLCEKPLTTTSASALAVVAAEAALGRRLVQVGFMRRFDPEYAALRELVAGGGLGTPLLVHCVHRNADAPPHATAETAVTDSLVHEADVVRFLLAEEIVAVTVLRPTATSRAPRGTADPLLVLFETAGGRLADVELFLRTGVAYEVRTELVGERGSASIGGQPGLLRTGPDGVRGTRLAPGFLERFSTAYAVELQHWVDAARGGTTDGPGGTVAPDSWDGYAAAAVCEATVRSVHDGGRVTVSLAERPATASPAPTASAAPTPATASPAPTASAAPTAAPTATATADVSDPTDPASRPRSSR